jgi:hypothetical protein
LHWQPGLDFFRDYGLSLIIIPHWNNTEGGVELDTSRCFMGKERFEELQSLLSCDGTVVGIDEHTSLWIDQISGQAKVYGKDSVHIIRRGAEHDYGSGESIPLQIFGKYTFPDDSSIGVRPEVWQKLDSLRQLKQEERNRQPPDNIIALIQQRESARVNKDFSKSDRVRKQAEDQGWRIIDTPFGPQIEKM